MERENPRVPEVFSDEDSFSESIERNDRRKSQISALNKPKKVLVDPQKYDEHYNSCIKLASENKINYKNAFSLYLIDYLKEKLQDVGQGAFQVVSSSLDAGAKIYAGRVDAVHQETYQVLTGLGKQGSNKNPGEEDMDDGDDDVGEAGENPAEPTDENGVPVQNKKRETKRRANQKPVLCKNLNKIRNRGTVASTDIDPLFQHQAASFDEGGSSCLKLNKTPTCNNLGELFLDSKTSAFSAGNTIPAEQQNPEEPFVFRNVGENLGQFTVDRPLTHMAHDFHFIQRPDDEKNSTFLSQSQIHRDEYAADIGGGGDSDNEPDVIDDYPLENEPIYDEGMNAEKLYDGSPSSHKENIINSIVTSNNNFFNATGITENCLDLVNDIKSVLHDRMDTTSNQDITNLLGLWAGPKYWQKKIKKFQKDTTKKVNKSCSITSKAKKREKYLRYDDSMGSDKLTRSGKVPIVNFHDLGLKVTSDESKLASLTLAERTLVAHQDQWYVLDLDQATLPPAEVYQRGLTNYKSVPFEANSKIYSTMAREINFTLVTSRKSRIADSKNENGLVLIDLSRGYAQEREQDYADDKGDDGGDLFDEYGGHDDSYNENGPMMNMDDFAVPLDGNQEAFGTQGTAPFGTNIFTQEDGALELMDNPQNINKLNIDYAKQAKVINIRKVKLLTWEFLKKLPEESVAPEANPAGDGQELPKKQPRLEESENLDETKVEDMTEEKPSTSEKLKHGNESFVDMVDFLMKGLDTKTSSQMSCSLMFNSLLHLANEKNLFIKPHDFEDLIITRFIPQDYKSDIDVMIEKNIENTLNNNSKNNKRRQTMLDEFFDD